MKEFENPTLNEKAETDTEIKKFLVNYTGDKLNPEDDKVTVSMIIETMSEEFPELILALAEENWIRGYHQGLSDVGRR